MKLVNLRVCTVKSLELVLNFNARRVFSTRVLSLSLSMLAARHTFGRSATSKYEGVEHTSESDWTDYQESVQSSK